MKLLILGAAGRVAKILTNYLLEQTDFDLVYIARCKQRIKNNSPRVNLIDGDFADKNSCCLKDVDAVYLNHMADEKEGKSNGML